MEPPAREAAFSVHMTGYNAVPEQTKPDPTYTASGAFSNPDVIAARSRDLAGELPFGTVIAIEAPKDGGKSCGFSAAEPHIGYRVIADVMHQRMVNKIDIMFHADDAVLVGEREVNPAIALGVCQGVPIRVVGKISIQDMPDTQAELANMVRRSILAAR